MFSKNKEVLPADFEYFTLFDTKVGIYKEPMLAINRHDILRQLDALMRDPEQQKNQLVTNAEDFQLFSVGNFTKRSGQIATWQPEHVANLHEIKQAATRSTVSPQGGIGRVGTNSPDRFTDAVNGQITQ